MCILMQILQLSNMHYLNSILILFPVCVSVCVCVCVHVCMYVVILVGKILDRLLLQQSPLTVLELGAHCGYSTVRIARALPQGARHYSVEMDQSNAAIAEKVIRLAGFDDGMVSVPDIVNVQR